MPTWPYGTAGRHRLAPRRARSALGISPEPQWPGGSDQCLDQVIKILKPLLLLLLWWLLRRLWHGDAGPAGIRNGGLPILLLLLLHLQLALLHFLQHLLRSSHARLLLRGRLFRFRGDLILIIVGVFFLRVRLGSFRSDLRGLGRVVAGFPRLRRGVVRSSLGHQNYAHQRADIVGRAQQDVIEA